MLSTKPKPTPVVDLYNQVRGVVSSKGEFETTAAFNKRAEEALSKFRAHLEETHGSGHVVVIAPIYSKYEPDKGFFDVGANSSIWPITGWSELWPKPYERVNYDVVMVQRDMKPPSTYVGQNVYGAKKDIVVRTGTEYGAALVNMAAKPSSWLRGHFVVEMKPERAASINGKISALIIGDLTVPGAIDGVLRSTPTMQRPFDDTIDQHYVTMTAECGAVVATSTLEMLHRLH
jgi:hypothetical protein